MQASYNITTDRIVLDPEGVRLSDEQYQPVKVARFALWPGRKIFVAKWSIQAEDVALALAGEIAEDDTPDDVEARVERFQKWAEDAGKSAQSASDYSQEATTAHRRELAAKRATNEAERALYWTHRIRGAIDRATYRETPGVIARRIKGLEADKRKFEKESKFHGAFVAIWEKAEGLTVEKAKSIANYDQSNTWFDLDKGLITADEARTKSIAHHQGVLEILARQIEHTDNRLEYERALLTATGGLPTDGKVWEVGGAARLGEQWCEIAKVNRTTFNARYSWDNTKGYTKHAKTVAHGLMTAAEWQAYQQREYTPNE